MSNERSRDFGGAPSRGSDQGAAGRRDPGEEALHELARLIGGQTNPSDGAGKSESRYESRLSDVSRSVASYDDLSFEARRGAEPSGARAGGDFDFSNLDDHRGGRTHGRRGNEDFEAAHDDYAGDDADDEYDDTDEYEDESEGKRRRPTRMIMAVLGLAVFGSAAAYGYRTLVATAPSGPPPIIRADNSPTKMSPMNDVAPDSGRSDRSGEQMAPRSEDPINLAAGNPNVTPPPGGDPRPVHTVPIRPDQTANTPDRAPVVRPVTPPPPPPARQVTAPPPPPQVTAPPPQSPPPQRVAVMPPPADTATLPPESGGFVVQLVSVRNEADAQSEFRRLQAKFSSVLTGRQPLIRRKDRGEQVYYAALVGPFGAKTEADQLCEQLKAAGGSCYVYKN